MPISSLVLLLTIFALCLGSRLSRAAIICARNQPLQVLTLVQYSEDWSTTEGCLITGGTDQNVDDSVTCILSWVGAANGSRGARNIRLQGTQVTNVQLSFNTTFSKVTPTPITVAIDSCVFRADRSYWSNLIRFASPNFVPGSRITLRNNSFTLTTLSRRTGLFAIVDLMAVEWINVTVSMIMSRIVLDSTFFSVTGYVSAIALGLLPNTDGTIYEEVSLREGAQLFYSQNTLSIGTHVYSSDYAGVVADTNVVFVNRRRFELWDRSAVVAEFNTITGFVYPSQVLKLHLLLVSTIYFQLHDYAMFRMTNNSVNATHSSIAAIYSNRDTYVTTNSSRFEISNCTVSLTVSDTFFVWDYLHLVTFYATLAFSLLERSEVVLRGNHLSYNSSAVFTIGVPCTPLIAILFHYTVYNKAINITEGLLWMSRNSITGRGTVPKSSRNIVFAGVVLYGSMMNIADNGRFILAETNIYLFLNERQATNANNVLYADTVWSWNPITVTNRSVISITKSYLDMTIQGFSNAQLSIFYQNAATIVDKSSILITNATVKAVAYAPDGALTGSAAVLAAFLQIIPLTTQSLNMTNASLILVEGIVIQRDSPLSNYAIVGLLDVSRGNPSSVSNGSIIVRNNNSTIRVGRLFNANLVDFSILLSITSSSITFIEGAVLRIDQNSAAVGVLEPATTPSQAQPFFGVGLYLYNVANFHLSYTARLTFSRNTFDMQRVTVKGFNFINIESSSLKYEPVGRVDAALIALDHNEFRGNVAAPTLLFFSASGISTTNSSVPSAAFISLCANYINNKLLAEAYEGAPDFGLTAMGAQCNTHTKSSSLTPSTSMTLKVSRSLPTIAPTYSESLSWSASGNTPTLYSRSRSTSHHATRPNSSLSAHTATKSLIPLDPSQPDKVLLDDTEPVVGPAVGVGGALSPQAGGLASVAMATLRLSERCRAENADNDGNTDDGLGEPLSPFVHPLSFGLGSGPYRYYMGAVVGNCAVIPLCVAVLMRLWVPAALRRFALPGRPAMSEAVSYVGWPAALVMVAPPLAEGTAAAAANLMGSGLAGESLLGVLGAAVLAGSQVAWAAALWKKVHARKTVLVRAPFEGWLWAPFVSVYERERVGEGDDEELQRCAPLYGDSAWLWAGCAGYLCGLAVGVVEGLGERLPCGVALWVLLVFAIVQTGLACTTMVPAELVVEALLGMCLLLLCSSGLAAWLDGGELLSVEEENVVGAFVNVLSLFGLALGLALAVIKLLQHHKLSRFRLWAGLGPYMRRRAARALLASGDYDDHGIPLTALGSNLQPPAPLSDPMDLFLASIEVEVASNQRAKQNSRQL